MCYILYHPLDSEATLSDAGVIIERAHEWTVKRGVEEVFFSKVSRNFLEIFEKSIDKHKIDAILVCAVQSERFPEGFGSGKWARRESGGFHGRIRLIHPDTESEYNSPGAFMYLCTWKERCKGIAR